MNELVQWLNDLKLSTAVQGWLDTHVLVLDNAMQVGLIVLALLLGRLLGLRLRQLIASLSENRTWRAEVRGFVARLVAHSNLITMLAFLWIATEVGTRTDLFGNHLTALTVFGGALGIGIGLGLQKVASNLVSGLTLLMDKSIKPNDVIAVGDTYGWIASLGARYAAVRTRDGIEHLIPNEELITQRVENWSHSDKTVRLKVPVGISYKSDVRLAMRLCLEAAGTVERVLAAPEPRCLLRGFGDSSVDLEIRIWIDDPEEGRANVMSEVLLGVWDRFHEHGIEIPFPQRDLHLKSSDVRLAVAGGVPIG